MIQANELRIGNYIKFPELKPEVVTDISETHVNGERLSYAEPILLTEEILLKCCKSYEFFHDGVIIYKLGVFNVYKQKSIWVADGLGSYAKRYDHVKNLHQLQNLYFALTGKELGVRFGDTNSA